MAEKVLNSRIIHKHDVEDKWSLVSDFIPNQGEIIVYDVDENYNYERFKIGDGVTAINELPFVDENLRKNVAFIDENDSEDIIAVETGSPYAGTIHRFSVEVNCAPMYIPEDNLGPEFFDDYQPYTDYGVLIFPDSYTDHCKKTRLVISAHGGGGTVTLFSSQWLCCNGC